MSKPNAHDAVITEFDFKMIAEFFSTLPQQGPGSDAMTMEAISSIDQTDIRHIADLGCGTGRQTVVLTQKFPQADIVAEDLLPEALEGLRQRIRREGISNVYPLECAMDNLPFDKESLDLIWAEGSIYNIGFEKGLQYLHQFLRPSGYIALTDCVYLTNIKPDDGGWLENNFTDIATIAEKVIQLETNGYSVQKSFALPSTCWTEDYYKPMIPAMEAFLKNNPDNPTARFFVDRLHEEMNHYKEYGDYYGYAFFIARKR